MIFSSQSFNKLDNNICVNSAKVQLYSIYKHYTNFNLVFKKINIYKYFWFVFIIKQSQKQSINYKFDNKYREKKSFL